MSEKQAYTTAWLSEKYLSTMEWMPNENRIVLRGIGLQAVHEQLYTPHAKLCGRQLSYKNFRLCLPAAAVQCAKRNGDSEEDAELVKVGRSANHSNFPSCTTCTTLEDDYVKTASNPLADPAVVAKKRDLWMAHQKKFMKCRHVARSYRYATYHVDSNARYECDDKCGSFWCKCPVCAGGRPTKFTATRNYEFAVQANVVCGPEGVMRLAIIPKTVSTGANFGISTLLLALWSACRIKDGVPTLSAKVWRLFRHTDGGPDNVSKLTHIFHWLLVYIGCWEEVVWFMFVAGHSHTEIADRLFSLMKKLFVTDSAARVKGGIYSFEELEDHLKKTFNNCPEMKEIVYHFANWDVNEWLKGTVAFKDSALQKISTSKVYCYAYVGDKPCSNAKGEASNMAAVHGGVKVTFKAHISDGAPSTMDDEYGPIQRKSELNADGEQVQANRTTPEGVVFVSSPPSLTSEPKREPLPSK